MIKISPLSSCKTYNEACEHVCGWVGHLFNLHNSTTGTFSAILIPQNTPYSAKNFRRQNSAKYTFSKFHILHSTLSCHTHKRCVLIRSRPAVFAAAANFSTSLCIKSGMGVGKMRLVRLRLVTYVTLGKSNQTLNISPYHIPISILIDIIFSYSKPNNTCSKCNRYGSGASVVFTQTGD